MVRRGWRAMLPTWMVVVTAVAIVPSAAFAARLRPPAGARPAFDARTGTRAPVPAATRAARATLAHRLGSEGVLASDPVGGGIRALGRTDGFLSAPRAGDAASVALAYVRAHADAFGLGTADFAALRLVRRSRSHGGITHLTWVPTRDGVPAYDSELSVHVARDGRVIAADGPPLGGLALVATSPRMNASQALGVAQRDVGARMTFPAAHVRAGAQQPTTFANGDHASLVAFEAPDGDRLGWRLTVAGKAPYLYDEVVDASSGAVLARHSLTRFASNALVYANHPGAANGGVAQSVNLAADPNWLTSATTLSGRNVHAYADVNGSESPAGQEIAPSAGSDWSFAQTPFAPAGGAICSPFAADPGICTWDGANTATEATNRAQVTTQVFYFVNSYHDWLEQPAVGFTDASGNFEVGGSGGSDPVLAEADDAIDTAAPPLNNANMGTPPDGQSPVMQMYLFGDPLPAVNGGDDASVVLHEYTHGLSNRLIGDGGGLTQNQPAAMGEAWSDWYAMDYLVAHGLVTDSAASDGQVVVGAYPTGDLLHGVRNQALDCPVGTSAGACGGSVNAGHDGGFTYADLGHVGGFDASTPSFEVHDDGEIWSETLWDLRTALVGSFGATTGADTARELITDAMRLSPPNPSFLDERDAILEADLADFGGANRDMIWQVLAVRGMGYGARTTSPNATRGVASFATPTLAAPGATTIGDAGPAGNGNGVAEPGETISATVVLQNPGTVALTGIHATLSSASPGVEAATAPVAYGTIAAGGAHAAAPFTIALGATLTCGEQLPLTLHVTSDQGTIDLPVAVTLGSGRTAFLSTDAQAIPDDSPDTGASSTLTIPTGGRIDSLRVSVSIDHTFDGDLTGFLTSPHGTTIALFERPGTDPGRSAVGGFANVTFDDTAAPLIQDLPDSGPAASGSFRPDEPLAAFAGQDRAGTWTLRVTDGAFGDEGSIAGWSIDTDQPACSAPPVQTTTTPPPPTVTLPSKRVPPPIALSKLPKALKLDRHGRFAYAFATRNAAGKRGTLRFVVPKHGRTRALSVGAGHFVVARSGRVKLTIAVHGAALARLRKLHTATVRVTVVLGGRTFAAKLRLSAPSPRRRAAARRASRRG